MRTEGKVSKVAYCGRCNGVILVSHLDYIDKKTAKEFTELSNEGFVVKIETILESQARNFGTYSKCKDNLCVQNIA